MYIIIIKGLFVNIENTGSVLLSAPPNMTSVVMIMETEVHSNNELCYTAGDWFTGLLVIQYGRQLWDRRLSVPFSSARYRNKCGLLAPGTYRVLLFGYKPLAELGVFAALCCKLFGHFDKLICRFENICPLESIFKSIVIVSKYYL